MAPRLEWTVRGADGAEVDVAMLESDQQADKILLRSGIYGNYLQDDGDVTYYWINVISTPPYKDVYIYSKLPDMMKLGGYCEVKLELENLILNVITGSGFGEVDRMNFSFCYARSDEYYLFPNWRALFKMLCPCAIVPRRVTVLAHERIAVWNRLVGNAPDEERERDGINDEVANDDMEFEWRLPAIHNRQQAGRLNLGVPQNAQIRADIRALEVVDYMPPDSEEEK